MNGDGVDLAGEGDRREELAGFEFIGFSLGPAGGDEELSIFADFQIANRAVGRGESANEVEVVADDACLFTEDAVELGNSIDPPTTTSFRLGWRSIASSRR